MGSRFSFKEAIDFGWATMKENLGFFVGILILVWIIQGVPSILMETIGKEYPVLNIVISILSIFVNILVGMGLIRIALKFADGQRGQLEDLFSCTPIFLPYLGASILCGLAIMGGFVLLIIPGIILSIRLYFYSYLMIDRNFSAMESLKESFELTRGAAWDLFLFGIVIGLINLLGVLCLLVGLFATIPTSMVAYAYVYRKLLETYDGQQVNANLAPIQ